MRINFTVTLFIIICIKTDFQLIEVYLKRRIISLNVFNCDIYTCNDLTNANQQCFLTVISEFFHLNKYTLLAYDRRIRFAQQLDSRPALFFSTVSPLSSFIHSIHFCFVRLLFCFFQQRSMRIKCGRISLE